MAVSSKKGLLHNKWFYCDHLGANALDVQDIQQFSVRNLEIAGGLENYLKNHAFADENNNAMRTYLVRDYTTDELVGYFSIKSGMVSLNEREITDESGNTQITFDTLPGLEIANFAINEAYLKGHPQWKGIGIMIFNNFIRSLADQVAAISGTTVLYIFALPFDSLIDRYQKVYSFLRLDQVEEDDLHKRLKPFYDQSCIFMYQML